MISTKKKIQDRIEQGGRGSLWCANDFLVCFHRHEIDESFVRLTMEGFIRRVIPGIYEYPRYSELLQCEVATDLDSLAYAIARKFQWKICPSGEAALNNLGLSTQIPGRTIYISDGPNRQYHVENCELQFRHTSKRWMTFKHEESLIVVQGLMALGERQMTDKNTARLAKRFPHETWEKIFEDISAAPIWIVEKVRNICTQGRSI